MGRSAQARLSLLVIVCGILVTESVADFESCSSYSTIPGNVCVCQRIDNDSLLVNCSGHSGPLHLEDIACCTLRPAANENSSSTEIQGFDVDYVVAIYTMGSDLQELDFRMFNNFTNLHTLNVSLSGITNVTWENCSLPSLKILDLSHNNFTHLDQGFFMCNRSLSVLGMYGTPWDCELLSWFVDWVRKAENIQRLKIPGKPYILCYYYSKSARATNISDVIESCPKNCSCTIMRIDIMEVDCSNRGYYDFPERIPYNTRSIHMENNSIRSFQRILNLTSYQNVTMLYLDNNAIESLIELEGIQRYLRLSTLYLVGNRITDLPVYIMEQIEADDIKIGGNPWHCDCKRGTSLLNYLIAYHHRKIQDIGNITCAPTEGIHANKVVHRLTRTDLCYSDHNRIHPLDIVNIILALLIVIVLVKLIYDCWQFKRTGNLPIGPTYFVQMWKQRGARLNRAKFDCAKSLLTQK